MADEKQINEQAKPEETESQAKAPQKGLLKYVLFGLGGVVVIVVVAFGTLMLIGGDSSVETASDQQAPVSDTVETESGEHEHYEAIESADDSILALLENDSVSVIDEIIKNLEELDYAPEAAELDEFDDLDEVGQDKKAAEDSIKQVNWLEKEKNTLAAREKALNSREEELNALDKKVSQKILRLDQAESARIAQLAKLYDGMEAQAVARLMANLDDNTVVSILPRMKSKNASQVLSLMPAKRAAKLSKQMITIAEK